MIALIRAELYRTATIRSSWITIALFATAAASFGVLNPYGWALFAGIGTFGIAVFTVTRHFQHRTAALLYLAQPKRVLVLLSQVVTIVVVTWVFTAVTGITVLLKDGNDSWYYNTLTVIPIMAVFGAATATVVRRPTWLLFGFAVWFVLVEGLISHLNWPLPISAYLKASGGDAYGLEVFVVWALGMLAIAALMLRRDFTTD